MRFLIIRKPVSVYENICTVCRICLRASGWYSSGKHYISPRRETHRMKPNENSTVIGKSVTIRGEVSGKEEMFLDCALQGTVTLPENKLTIGPNARVQADLNAGDVVIYGKRDTSDCCMSIASATAAWARFRALRSLARVS